MSSAVIQEKARELARIEAELARRRYLRDPEMWVQKRLGDTLWSAQRKILQSVRDFRRTAVQSCHEIGKSFIASRVVGWWLDAHPPGEAFVVTSAPSANQVKAILWKEIGRVHALGGLRGYVNQSEWRMVMPAGNDEPVAFGRKPDDYNPTAFQGIHARFVLLVFDEACGMPDPLWEAGDSLIANDYSKILVIGNPDDPTTKFAEVCKPGSGYNVVQIGAFDTPNFTGERMPRAVLDQLIGKTYVEEKRKKWAPTWRWTPDGTRVVPPPDADPQKAIQDTNPLWQSKVLGVFPPNSEESGLIPVQWIRAAQERSLEPRGPNELGVDVGGGGDSSTVAHRRGPVVRIIHEDHNPDTMQTCGHVVRLLTTTKATAAKVDLIGIGRGVVDRGKELKKPFFGINVAEAPVTDTASEDEEAFVNLRAQLYWAVRERFEQGDIDIDPNDEDLAGELVSIRFKRTSSGKIQIESKDEAKRRGVPSPNRADALMLSFAPTLGEMDVLVW